MGNCLCGGGGGDAGAAAAAREMLAPAGLGAYAGTLARAGFDRREALAGLCEADLRAVEAFSGQAIPPGHRKGILQAARRYGRYGRGRGRRRGACGSVCAEGV